MSLTKDTLDISIVMATWNRSKRLEQTLTHFSKLDTRGIQWELIIIANGCTDATDEIVARFAKILPIVSLQEPVASKSRAMNRGLAMARGDILILTDDDIIPDSDWLQEWLRAARRWPNDAVFGGRIDPLFPPETPAWLAHPDFEFAAGAFAQYVPAHTEGPVNAAPYGPNQAVRKQALAGMQYCDSVGPQGSAFAMGNDVELMRRLHHNGHRYIYVPTARVQHPVEPHQLTLKWLLGRAHRLGRGHVRLRLHDYYHDYEQCVYLFGAPRFLWRQAATYWLKHAMNRFSSTEKRFKTGYPLAIMRGMIHEYRVMTYETSQQNEATPQVLQP
jgi:hypothetical protein